MEDRRNVGENSCNSGEGTDQTGPILDVYDDDEFLLLLINRNKKNTLCQDSNEKGTRCCISMTALKIFIIVDTYMYVSNGGGGAFPWQQFLHRHATK